MDSLTQFALGAAVGVATIGRRTSVARAALWGGVCGTLPDLDVFVDRGDPIRDMILHRTESHALLYQTIVAPLIAFAINAAHGERQFPRWWLTVWLALITHPLLDLMTVYGTQLGLPFTRTPFFVGSVFVIDPVVTVALAAGTIAALTGIRSGWRWNTIGLTVAVGYLAWGTVAQAHVRTVASESLARSGIEPTGLLVTPTPFNSVLWRIVAMTPDAWYEGSRSLLDPDAPIAFVRRPTGRVLYEDHADDERVRNVAWFSHGFFDIAATPAGLRIRDLRMGFGDYYTFTFLLPPAADTAQGAGSPRVVAVPRVIDLRQGLPWLWRRLLGAPSPFPVSQPAGEAIVAR